MNITVTASMRLRRLGDGQYYTTNPSLAYAFWARYLDVFDAVTLVCRTEIDDGRADQHLVSGANVTVVPLPDFRGGNGLRGSIIETLRILRTCLKRAEAVSFRIPCPIGLLAAELMPTGRPFSAEVVGDPWDSLSPRASTHSLRASGRILMTWSMQRACKKASCVSYVTEGALQRRYPPASDALSTTFSNVLLDEGEIVDSGTWAPNRNAVFTLVTVGSLEHMYKGVDDLIRAVAILQDRHKCVRLNVIGDGAHRERLEQLAKSLHVAENIRFCGHVGSRARLFRMLASSDLFVLASRQEGVPRAMLEAMAQGVPCIGTRVGGIPELLPVEALVRPNDPSMLADLIAVALSRADLLSAWSIRASKLARNFTNDTLAKKRMAYYRHLQKITSMVVPRDSLS